MARCRRRRARAFEADRRETLSAPLHGARQARGAGLANVWRGRDKSSGPAYCADHCAIAMLGPRRSYRRDRGARHAGPGWSLCGAGAVNLRGLESGRPHHARIHDHRALVTEGRIAMFPRDLECPRAASCGRRQGQEIMPGPRSEPRHARRRRDVASSSLPLPQRSEAVQCAHRNERSGLGLRELQCPPARSLKVFQQPIEIITRSAAVRLAQAPRAPETRRGRCTSTGRHLP